MRELKAEEQLLYKQILAKRHASIPLTTKEENFARSLFFDMLTSKKSFQRTFRVITGEELRKSKTDAPAAREGGVHPRQVGTKPESDNPTAQPDTSARGDEKLPDVDNKPKQLRTEEQKLSDILQTNVDRKQERTAEPQAKSADVIALGDKVVKAYAGAGLARGTVVALNKNGQAIVLWERGFQTTETASALVKAGRLDEATPAKKPGEDKQYPVEKAKGEATPEEVKEMAERLKDKPEVDEPYALAQHIVEQTDGEKEKKVKKDGDIVPEPEVPNPYSGQPVPAMPEYTPFQCLVHTLEATLGLASTIKTYREQASHDEEVTEYYDGILDNLRGIAEDILAALSMELDEAKAGE